VPTNVLMPRLSVTMKEGTVGKWYKNEGETIEKGEPIAEILSEKATYDLESPATGIVRKILVQAGTDTSVNSVLAIITAPDEPFPQASVEPATNFVVTGSEGRILASPAAKRLAKEQGIDLATVKGTGPEGRIDEDDVKRHLDERSGSQPRIKEVRVLSGFRKTSAERLTTSFRSVPHSTVAMEVDVSNASKLHEKLKISYTAIIVKAVAKALIEAPLLNASLDGDKVKIFEDINVGVAVATDNGLVVPVIRNSNQKTLKEIDCEVIEMTAKAKEARLSKEDVSGGTFTVTNLGMYGVDFFIPIINLGEAAILAVGRITEKPVAVESRVEIRPIMVMSVAYDHRIVDGAPAAQFLQNVKEKMEKMQDSKHLTTQI
jgi:pyruvate dehydrogenase E2 component (dihydrolipoyllysine-residue acetyltransferase)